MGTASGGIAPLKQGTHAKLGDGMGKLKLPDGRMLEGLSGGEIARALLKLGVPGVSHSHGREANARVYAGHLDEIRAEGGEKGVVAWLQEIENARRSSISNLRDNLARRRVLGSSFGADAETRAELEFAQQKERVQAESFLQEIDMTNKLIGQEFDLRRQEFSTKLGENLQAEVAGKLSAEVMDLLTASAQLQAQLAASGAGTLGEMAIAQAKVDADAQAGAGALIGKVAGVALAPYTGGASLALAK